jgi:hypothetical protein
VASEAPPRKADFANGALRYVNGSRLRALVAVTLAVALAATTAGAFGTHVVPLPQRTLFWVGLFGWNLFKWELMVQLLRRRGLGHVAIALAGTLLMVASLPFEINAALRLLTDLAPGPIGQTFLRAAVLALIGLIIFVAFLPWLAWRHPMRTEADSSGPPPRFANTSILLRDIAALVAEDHYVRIHLADGSDRLIHGRLRDAVAAMGEARGCEVRRGAWIADAHRGETCRGEPSASGTVAQAWLDRSIRNSPRLTLVAAIVVSGPFA